MSLLDNIQLNNSGDKPTNPLLQALKAKQRVVEEVPTKKEEPAMIKTDHDESKEKTKAALMDGIKEAVETIEKQQAQVNPPDLNLVKDDTKTKEEPKTEEIDEDDLIKKIENVEIEEAKEKPKATPDTDVVETKEDSKMEAEEAVEEEKEVSEEVKKKEPKKVKAVKKTKKAEPKVEEIPEEEADYVTIDDMPKTSLDFADCVERVSPHIRDEEWNIFTKEVEEEKQKLLIPPDMTTSDMSMILSHASNLRLKLSNPYAEYKNLHDTLASRETDGLLRIVKKLNATGTNSDEREKFGIEACMNHHDMNLYELLAVVRKRYYYIKESYDFVKDISSLMITSNGNLKLQQYQNVNSDEKKFQ